MALVNGPVEGVFGAAGQSDAIRVRGTCNVTLFFGGAVATVKLEKSFDDGVTWFVVSKNTSPEEASFADNVNAVIEEHEANVQYRWNCTAYTSGSITYRIGKAFAAKREML